MKAKLFFIPFMLAVFISVFAAKETPVTLAPLFDPDECCQDICVFDQSGNPIPYCEVCIYKAGVLIACKQTDAAGVVQFCNLKKDAIYYAVASCCSSFGTIPEFQACSDRCFRIDCFL